MGYNISDIGGETSGGADVWTATLDLNLGNSSTISGDFQVVSTLTGADQGEATDGYVFSALSNPAFGTLVSDPVTGTYTFTPNWSAILATGTDQIVSFTVTGTSGGNSDTDTVNITLLICVARGTRVFTTRGPVNVEDLAAGDYVTTLDGAPQQVRWIGSRRVTSVELAADPSLRPVRIAAGALGPGQPDRDLLVSPQHRVYLRDWRAQLMFGDDQVLVPAKGLINDTTIRQDMEIREVEYFHILFDTHEIIFTEGLATESFHPGAYTISALSDPAREELFRLFPALKDEGSYGAVARPALRPWETRMLADTRREDRT